MTLHQALDVLVAGYLETHPDKLPSTTTVMELIEWSAAQVGPAPADAPRCAKCGAFLSAVRVEMRIDRCSKCDPATANRGARRGVRR